MIARKKKLTQLLLLGLAVAVVIIIVVPDISTEDDSDAEKSHDCGRIISTAPSITETLFSLGLGDSVVGVSEHSDYPQPASELPVVGTYVDIYLEQLIALHPDTVVALREQKQLVRSLDDVNVSIIVVDQHTAPGLLRSFRIIGSRCGAGERASEIIEQIHEGFKRVTQECEREKRLRTMIVVGRCLSCDGIRDVFVAGGNGFYEQLIYSAGGENVFRAAVPAFPSVGIESIIAADPEVIIDIIPDQLTEAEMKKHRETWNELRTVTAVKTGQVHVVTERFMLRPGPDVVFAAELMCSILREAGGDNRP